MIVISSQYLAAFNTEKNKIQSDLDSHFIDIIPVKILNDNYILPESVLTHPVFSKIFSSFTDYTIREVSENEFIKIDLK